MTESAPRWTAGDHIVIVWSGGSALIDESVGLGVAERIWTRMRRDPQLGTFLKTLAEGSDAGFLDLPSFAVVVRDGERYHLAVRGSLRAEVQRADATEVLSGEGITTWAERVLVSPLAIQLGSPGPSEGGAPIADGVVRGSSVITGEIRSEPSELREAVEPVAPVEIPPEAAVVEPLQVEPIIPQAEEREPASAHTTYAEVDEDSEPLEEPTPQPLAEPTREPAAVPAPNPYDSLWDHSIALDVEAAAIRDEDAEVPLASPPATDVVEVMQVSAEQLSGDTVADEGSVQVEMPGAVRGPSVLARFCDRDHANPPERAVCFVCGAAVAGEARITERPQLGWLRVEGGETIPLRGPIIAGRNPRSTALKLDETPRLVALPHPHVSGTHLAVTMEGWRLMVRDLNSSNGTYLRRHGEAPVRLPEAAVPLVAGDLIDLGKGLFLRLERTP